jgi:hypothetical protein
MKLPPSDEVRVQMLVDAGWKRADAVAFRNTPHTYLPIETK